VIVDQLPGVFEAVHTDHAQLRTENSFYIDANLQGEPAEQPAKEKPFS
jgi:hypothetical protein